MHLFKTQIIKHYVLNTLKIPNLAETYRLNRVLHVYIFT